jgi:hypothetical protein
MDRAAESPYVTYGCPVTTDERQNAAQGEATTTDQRVKSFTLMSTNKTA